MSGWVLQTVATFLAISLVDMWSPDDMAPANMFPLKFHFVGSHAAVHRVDRRHLGSDVHSTKIWASPLVSPIHWDWLAGSQLMVAYDRYQGMMDVRISLAHA